MTTQQKTPKRKKGQDHAPDYDSDSDYENETEVSEEAWPRFLIVTGTDESQPLSSLTPWTIQKCIESSAGTVKSTKRLRDGSFLIECKRKQQSLNLLTVKTFVSVPVQVRPHHFLNSSKGVIRCPDLAGIPERDILEELKKQNVTNVKRCVIKKNGKEVKTNTFFITFAMPTVPSRITIGYLKVPVQVFVPAPVRCFKCQQFGHMKSKCTKQEVCARCSKSAHEGECSSPPSCVNCKEEHPSSSRQCPLFLKENEIQRVRTTEKCSYSEAKDKLGYNKTTRSFSSVTASSAPSFLPQQTGHITILIKSIQSLAETVNKLVQKVEDLEKKVNAPFSFGSFGQQPASSKESGVVFVKASGGANKPQSTNKATASASKLQSKASEGALNSQKGTSSKPPGGASNPKTSGGPSGNASKTSTSSNAGKEKASSPNKSVQQPSSLNKPKHSVESVNPFSILYVDDQEMTVDIE